jgi:hypothetical protein
MQTQKLEVRLLWGTNLGEKTSNLVPFFIKKISPCVLFSSWLLISLIVLTKLGPSSPNLVLRCVTFIMWVDRKGRSKQRNQPILMSFWVRVKLSNPFSLLSKHIHGYVCDILNWHNPTCTNLGCTTLLVLTWALCWFAFWVMIKYKYELFWWKFNSIQMNILSNIVQRNIVWWYIG